MSDQAQEPMYEVTVDHWGAQAPHYDRGDTFVPSMLPERDLAHFERHGTIRQLAADDPRAAIPPTGPRGSLSGSDGWATRYSPEPQPRHVYDAAAARGGPLVTGEPAASPEVPWSPYTVDERPDGTIRLIPNPR